MLAMDFKGQDLAGFFVSEKMDGYRSIWNGKNFISRTGHIIQLPFDVTIGLPENLILDGELWFGRGNFQECTVLRRKYISENDISRMKFVVFDVVNELPFEIRLASAQKAVTRAILHGNSYVEMVEYKIVKNTQEALAMMTELCRKNAEGMMARAPQSLYETKRSKFLLKLKPINSGQAELVGLVHNKQAYAMKDTNTDLVFNIRATKKLDYGEITDYFHNGFTSKGLPRFPRLSK
jgi:DNA ligase-1